MNKYLTQKFDLLINWDEERIELF